VADAQEQTAEQRKTELRRSIDEMETSLRYAKPTTPQQMTEFESRARELQTLKRRLLEAQELARSAPPSGVPREYESAAREVLLEKRNVALAAEFARTNVPAITEAPKAVPQTEPARPASDTPTVQPTDLTAERPIQAPLIQQAQPVPPVAETPKAPVVTEKTQVVIEQKAADKAPDPAALPVVEQTTPAQFTPTGRGAPNPPELTPPAATPAVQDPAGSSLTAEEKKKRLKTLLDLYKADKITPLKYQQERAKILGYELPSKSDQ